MQVFFLWKCRVSFVDGMLARRRRVHVQRVGFKLEEWPRELAWASRILCNHGDFDRRRKKTDKTTTWRYGALGPGLWSCTRLSRFGRRREARDNARLAKVEKQGETKMVRCLKIALYQTRKSREVRKSKDNSMPWGSSVQIFRNQDEEAVHWRFVSHPSCTLCHSTYSYISGNKRKRKETDIFYISVVAFLCIQNIFNNFLRERQVEIVNIFISLNFKRFIYLIKAQKIHLKGKKANFKLLIVSASGGRAFLKSCYEANSIQPIFGF